MNPREKRLRWVSSDPVEEGHCADDDVGSVVWNRLSCYQSALGTQDPSHRTKLTQEIAGKMDRTEARM